MLQALWPDLVIDGAIRDFGCQVSRHPWDDDTACLISHWSPTGRGPQSREHVQHCPEGEPCQPRSSIHGLEVRARHL